MATADLLVFANESVTTCLQQIEFCLDFFFRSYQGWGPHPEMKTRVRLASVKAARDPGHVISLYGGRVRGQEVQGWKGGGVSLNDDNDDDNHSLSLPKTCQVR